MNPRHPDWVKRIRLADNPNTPPETLTHLAEDEDWYVRVWVARNPNTPPKTLTCLADDEDWRVREGVAKNPNTPPEVLAQLTKDKDSDVRTVAKFAIKTALEKIKQKASLEEEHFHNWLETASLAELELFCSINFKQNNSFFTHINKLFSFIFKLLQ
jgi:hypothetical protein